MIWLLLCLCLFWVLLIPYPTLLLISVLMVGVIMLGAALVPNDPND